MFKRPSLLFKDPKKTAHNEWLAECWQDGKRNELKDILALTKFDCSLEMKKALDAWKARNKNK